MAGIEFVELPTIRFVMGSDDHIEEPDDDEGPSRQVSVGRMFVSRTPITVEHFAEFADAHGYVTTAERENSGFVGSYPDHELRTGATWRRPGGETVDDAASESWVRQVSWTDAQHFCDWSGTRLLTEAEFERLSPELGDALEPTLGEVWEWCADYYDATFHRDEQRVNPVGPHHGTRRVARGGSERPTARASFFPDFGASFLTFRVCRIG